MTTIADTFTRADADALGTLSDSSGSWTEVVGDTDIVSNAADHLTEPSLNRAEVDLVGTDHYAQIQQTATTYSIAACCRFDASAQTYYRLRAHWNTDQVWLEKVVATAVTILAGPTTTSPTLSGTDTFRLEVVGTTLVGKVNGTQQITVSDSAISTGTRTGFGSTASGSSNSDNFQAGDILAPPAGAPDVEEVIESAVETTAVTAHTVNLPTATSGQLLLVIADKGSTSATITQTAGATVTELLDEASANGLYIAYRQMDGSEGASITLTTSAATRLVEMAYRISGAANPATQAPEIGTTGTGTSTTPDPPAAVMTGGSKDYLVIAFYGAAGEEADDDTWSDTPPSGYTPSPPRQKTCGIVGTNLGGLLAAAELQVTASAENPGTFAKDVSAAWRSQTITIHPPAAAAASPPKPLILNAAVDRSYTY